VEKDYGSSSAVIGPLDFAIGEGEFFSILGPSGCGKSTTLRMIAGLERPTSGTVRIRGVDMTATPANHRPTNMVFQSLALFPHLTVGQNIAFGLKIQKVRSKEIRERISTMLDIVQLEGFEHRSVLSLSGGERQRVAIARALALRPLMLLLDEPLGALDVQLRHTMQDVLKDIQRRTDTSFVYVTHDQSEAFAMADRIAVMRHGQVLQVGPPREVYEKPNTEFVARFVGAANLMKGEEQSGTFVVDTLPVRVPGKGKWLAVRREAILLGAEADGAACRVDGRLKDIRFLGSTVECHVEVADGQIIAAVLPQERGNSIPLRDEVVTIGWRHEDCILLTD
jgi:ABC-type Fe3+/spermidine/putrescine transport system ATPase subunit